MPHDDRTEKPERIHEPRLLLDDVLQGLQWPKLLRAGMLALRPERLLLGTAAVLVLAALGRINLLWSDPGEGFGDVLLARLGSFLLARDAGEAVASAALLPRTLVAEFRVSTFALGIPMLVAWGVFGGAVSRSAALEVSLARDARWPALLAFGLRYARSAAGAIFIPIFLIGVAYLLVAGAGWALLSLPGLNWVGAVLLGVALLIGLAASLLALVIAVGSPMLIPSVAAEGSDAFDAIQRILAYVSQRPLTTFAYGLIAGASAAVGVFLVNGVIDATTTWTLSAATEWLSPNAADALAGDDAGTAGRIVEAVLTIPAVLAAGYVFSAVHCAGTVWYLVCRRACDRQDISELWDPEP